MITDRNKGARPEKVFSRLSPFERELLRRLQDRERLNVSEAIRLAIREAAKARGLWPANGEEFEG